MTDLKLKSGKARIKNTATLVFVLGTFFSFEVRAENCLELFQNFSVLSDSGSTALVGSAVSSKAVNLFGVTLRELLNERDQIERELDYEISDLERMFQDGLISQEEYTLYQNGIDLSTEFGNSLLQEAFTQVLKAYGYSTPQEIKSFFEWVNAIDLGNESQLQKLSDELLNFVEAVRLYLPRYFPEVSLSNIKEVEEIRKKYRLSPNQYQHLSRAFYEKNKESIIQVRIAILKVLMSPKEFKILDEILRKQKWWIQRVYDGIRHKPATALLEEAKLTLKREALTSVESLHFPVDQIVEHFADYLQTEGVDAAFKELNRILKGTYIDDTTFYKIMEVLPMGSGVGEEGGNIEIREFVSKRTANQVLPQVGTSDVAAFDLLLIIRSLKAVNVIKDPTRFTIYINVIKRKVQESQQWDGKSGKFWINFPNREPFQKEILLAIEQEMKSMLGKHGLWGP